jgi:hypothetical protein
MQDAHALVVALLADPDEVVGRALEPGRHHAPVVMPDGAEFLPLARVAPHRPVLDQLADGETVGRFAWHARLLLLAPGGTLP